MMPQQGQAASQALRCGLLASGVILMLLIYGVLQERIMQVPYEGALFTFSVFLVFLNRLAALVFASGMAFANGQSLMPEAPLWKYSVVSFSNVFASACQYEALKYVSFAVQMLGKSFKMMPVMVWGVALNGKKYTWRDWLVALVVTLGVTQFLLTGPTEAQKTPSSSSPSQASREFGTLLHGLTLLVGFLALDGLTSTMQEKLFTEHSMSKYNQMFYVNGFSVCVSLITLLSSGSLVPAGEFFAAHSKIIVDSMVLSLSAVFGQYFIYSLVAEFGALVLAATMNVRQVVSIIASYIAYNHLITPLQISALGLVAAALFYKSYAGLQHASEKRARPQGLEPTEGQSLTGMREESLRGASGGTGYAATATTAASA